MGADVVAPDPFEYYPTPAAFTAYLFSSLVISGRIFDPCVGAGDVQAAAGEFGLPSASTWTTNDLDTRWPADMHHDARSPVPWEKAGPVDWTVTNPPFTPAIEIIDRALLHSRVGVAMHLRSSIHEVLKTGRRRTWMNLYTPTGILWLPRFAYQRSRKTGEWSQDSVCACWVIWITNPNAPQFIKYAPEWVIDRLRDETPAYRTRMDALMAKRDKVAAR